MLKRPGKLRRGLTVLGVAIPTIFGFSRALWRQGGSKRSLAPLVIILCLLGLLFLSATSVEALAPFIYTIF